MDTKLYEKLYQLDFNQWREVIIKHIKERNFQEIDWENLLIELEDMGKSEKRAFISNLTILIAHLLKLMVQKDAPDSMKGSWYTSVTEHRFRIQKDLEENPSFKAYLAEEIIKAYQDGRKLAIKEGQKARFCVRKPSLEEYPNQCPFTIEQLLDEDFYAD
ncbi:MAG TPA: DUF29 domain-containing protein [Cyanothece sp. UBA12306]|nr:DUF29 domain-containing protein [Cyanothece sp. UBA12306]